MNKLEREQMEAHDREMQRPVSELFPRPPKGFKQLIHCKGCGKEFWWTQTRGKERIYCTSDCKGTLGSSSHRRHSP